MNYQKLNEAVAVEIMGEKPSLTWEVSADGGKSSRIGFDNPHEARAWLAEARARGLHAECAIVTWKHWRRYSQDISAAMEVVEKMRAKSWSWAISSGDGDGPVWIVICANKQWDYKDINPSLPCAICITAMLSVRAAKDLAQSRWRAGGAA